MRTKRVSVSLSDAEIDLIHAALLSYSEDKGATGEDADEGSDNLQEKILKARRRVRAHQ